MSNRKSYEIAFRLGASLSSSVRQSFQKASNQMDNLQKKATLASKQLGRSGSKMSRLSSAITSFGSKAALGLGAAGVAAGALAVQVSRTGVAYNAMMEQSQIAWETILGSQKEAQKTLSKLQVMGAKTPYEFEGLDKAAKLLNMAGFEGGKLFSTLTNVGDAVAAIGGGQEELEGVSMAIFQMATKGKVSAEEMNQLAERGIPAWKLIADQMGVTQRELMDMSANGELMADKVIPLLVKGMGDRFGGAMKKQSSTFNGMMSTLKDNAKILSAQMSKGTFEKLKGVLPVVNRLLEKTSGAFEKGGWKGVAKELIPSSVLKTAGKTFNTLKSFYAGYFKYVKNVFSGSDGAGSSLGSMFLTLKTYALPILKDIGSFLKGIGTQLLQFWQQNGPQIIQAVQNVFKVMAAVFKAIAPIAAFVLKALLTNVKGLIQGALDVILGLIRVFMGIFTGDWKSIGDGLKQIFGGAIQALWNLWNLLMVGKLLSSLKAIGKGIVNWFKGIGVKAMTNVQYYYHLFQDGFYKIAMSILKWIGSAILKAVGIVKTGVTQFIQVFQLARTFGVNIFMSILNAIRTVFVNGYSFVLNSLRTFIASGVGAVRGFLSSIQNIFLWLYARAYNIFQNIMTAMVNPIKTAKSVIETVIQGITGYVSGMFSQVTGAGKTAINGLIMAANAMINGINGISVNIPDWVPKYGGKSFGLSLPNIPMLASGGITTGPTLAMIGEGAEQEAVLPLSKLDSLLNGGSKQTRNPESNPQYVYSPQYNIYGDTDIQKIKQMDKENQADFERRVKKFNAHLDRTSLA